MGQVTHQKSYSKIYRTWIAMLSRCRNPNDNNYIHYGARGIKVCERWHVFENFYADMGDHPFYIAQIDRIDNEKGYCPENCRWVTAKENSRNRRTTVRHDQIVQQALIEQIGWSKNQFRWYMKRYGISWILENFRNHTLPSRVNKNIDRQDIIDHIFGEWKVLSFESYTKKAGHLYKCQCSCGIQKLIPRNNLMKNKTSSCRSCSTRKKWKERDPSLILVL